MQLFKVISTLVLETRYMYLYLDDAHGHSKIIIIITIYT